MQENIIPKTQLIPQTNKQIKQQKDTSDQSEQSSCLYYILSWGLFIAAFAIYVVVWAIDKYAIMYLQNSFYYHNQFKVSGNTQLTSNLIFSDSQLSDIKAIFMPLVYNWISWKLALIIYSYHLIQLQANRILRFVSFAIFVFLLFGVDIALTVIIPTIYNQGFLYGFYAIMLTGLSTINNFKDKPIKNIIMDSFVVQLFVAGLYAIYCFLIPFLFNLYSNSFGSSYGHIFLHIYLLPFWDCALYISLLALGSEISPQVKRFYSMIHFFLLGYAVGTVLLVGYTEVQFYYLLTYFLLKNIFANWIMWKWENVINNPPCLPGWIFLYYGSYLLHFIPINGIGKLCISKGYWSQLLSKTSPLLYVIPSSLYPSSSYSSTDINTTFSSNIYWMSSLIIWIFMTFSQKYSRTKPTWKDLFYYIWGIYLFYIGLCSGLQVLNLSSTL